MIGDVGGKRENRGLGTEVSGLPYKRYTSQIPDSPDDHLDEYMMICLRSFE